MGILDMFRGSKTARVARRVMADLRKLGETRRMEFDEETGALLTYDEGDKVVSRSHLDSLIHEIDRAAESEHDEIYRRYVGGFHSLGVERNKDYAVVKPNLRVMFKDATYPEFIALMNRANHADSKPNPLVWRPFAADLILCCAEELENSLSFVAQGDLDDWGVSADRVLDDALANTRALPIEFGGHETVRFVVNGDSFIASRLVCEDAIRQLPLRGQPVAVIPDRNTLFFSGSEDEEGLAALARLVADQFKDANRHISGRPVVLTEAGWREFTPPEPVRQAFANLARQYDAMYWSDYQQYLEKDLEARGEDIFVAKLSLYEVSDTGEYYSSIVWSRDVDSIFPVADRVYFYDGIDETIRHAAWADVLRVMGSAMKPIEGVPARYRVNAFPTTGQFLAMGAKLQEKSGSQAPD